MRSLMILAAMALASPAGAGAQQLGPYAGRWVPKELVDSAGREVTDTTIQIREPLRPVVTERLRPDDRRQFQVLVGMAQPSRSIEFNPAGDTVRVTFNDELTFALRPGGAPVLDTLGGEIPLRVRARWEDRNLAIEFEPEGGGKYVESYALADSRLFMRVDARIEWGKIRARASWSEMYQKVRGTP